MEFVPLLTLSTYQELIPEDIRGLDEAALDQELLRRGLRFVVEDPGRYALLSISRIKSYFVFWPTPDSSLVSNVSRVLSFGILLPFMLYGLAISAAQVFRNGLDEHGRAIVLLYAFVSLYSLAHLLSWALIRYRLPVDAVLLVFAGLAIAELAGRVTSRPARILPA